MNCLIFLWIKFDLTIESMGPLVASSLMVELPLLPTSKICTSNRQYFIDYQLCIGVTKITKSPRNGSFNISQFVLISAVCVLQNF